MSWGALKVNTSNYAYSIKKRMPQTAQLKVGVIQVLCMAVSPTHAVGLLQAKNLHITWLQNHQHTAVRLCHSASWLNGVNSKVRDKTPDAITVKMTQEDLKVPVRQ